MLQGHRRLVPRLRVAADWATCTAVAVREHQGPPGCTSCRCARDVRPTGRAAQTRSNTAKWGGKSGRGGSLEAVLTLRRARPLPAGTVKALAAAMAERRTALVSILMIFVFFPWMSWRPQFQEGGPELREVRKSDGFLRCGNSHSPILCRSVISRWEMPWLPSTSVCYLSTNVPAAVHGVPWTP